MALNIFSVCQYKSYLKERRSRDEEAFRISLNSTNVSEIPIGGALERRKQRNLTLKEREDRKAETNMLYMALTLCSISILSRFIFISCYIYFFFYSEFSDSLLVVIISYSVHTIVPSSAIFVFYFFNKLFRERFRKMFFSNKATIQESTSGLNRQQQQE